MGVEIVETQVFTDEEIRDTNAHNSAIANTTRYPIVTVFIDNGLDQAVQIQIKANRTNAVAGHVDVGAALNVATVDTDARTITPAAGGYLPFYFVEATCAVAPTDGELNVYIITTR